MKSPESSRTGPRGRSCAPRGRAPGADPGALPTISDRKQAEIELAAIAAGVRLPDDYGERLREVENRLREARNGEAEYRRDLANVAEAMAALRVRQDLIAADEPVRALFERKSAIQKSKEDCTAGRESSAGLSGLSWGRCSNCAPAWGWRKLPASSPGWQPGAACRNSRL